MTLDELQKYVDSDLYWDWDGCPGLLPMVIKLIAVAKAAKALDDETVMLFDEEKRAEQKRFDVPKELSVALAAALAALES